MWIFRGKDSDLVKTYKHYRKLSAEMVNEVMRSPSAKPELTSGAFKALGILKGNKLVLEDQSEEAACMDFMLHDYRVDGKSLVESYAEATEAKDFHEQQVLDAWLAAYTSCFKVTHVSPTENYVCLQNLLDPSKEEIQMMDLSMSKSTQPGVLLFTRILPFPKFNMSSGNTFAFAETVEKQVLAQYKTLAKKTKTLDERTRRFVCFFKLNRTLGINVQYR